MLQPNRRSFLGCLGAGMLTEHLTAAASRPIHGPVATGADLDALVDLVRKTPRRELLGKALELQADWRDLLAAAFLAGIRDVEPRPVGFQFHCVMMTNSAFDIAARAPAAERLAAALYNLDDFKRSQERDAQGGDWSMGKAPATNAVDVGLATARVTEVLETWDLDGADHAATALSHCASLDEAFEPLWWFCMRNFTNIGHNPIFAAQAHRTLQHIGWRHGTDVLRSLVYGLLDGKPGAADETFVANQERAAKLVLPGSASASKVASQELVAELRQATPEGASTSVADALSKGLSLDSVWDVLRILAAEQSWRDPGILSAHAMTSVNALRYIASRARSAVVRSMAILQAASWQVLYRDFLSRRSSYDGDAPGIETLQPADQGTNPAADAAAVFATAGDDARAAAPLALAAAQNGTTELMAATRHWLLRKAREHHDYKFAAALLEEMQAAGPETAGRMFAASLGYLRKPSDRDHDLWALVSGH